MKRLFVFLLVFGMCSAMLASCDLFDPVMDDYGDILGDGADDDADRNNGESGGNKDEESDPNMEGFPDLTEIEAIKGEEITEEEFNKALWNHNNFTSVIYNMNDSGIIGTMYHKADGKTYVTYESDGNKIIYGAAAFKVEGKIISCNYKSSKKSWEALEYNATAGYPLNGLPVVFEDLEFDAETGSYSVSGLEIENAITGWTFRFKDGNVVYAVMEREEMEKKTTRKFIFSDYGTTEVVSPDAVKIEGLNKI